MDIRKKSKYNILSGVIGQILTIILGILVPRILLKGYGSEINGLLTSITNIYSYFILLEAGVGTAALTALYKTISLSDNKSTNRIMSATHKYYKKTGCLYALCVIVFAGVYPMMIKTTIPNIVIILIVIFNGFGSVINFFFQGKYKLLLQADGKNYLITNVTTAINVATSIAKIALISLKMDVLLVQFIVMLINISQMLYFELYIRKHYNWLNIHAEPDYNAISQSKNIIFHQVSGLIFNSTDTIILSVFIGLKTVSVYSMYTLLFGMISTALNTVSSGFSFILGQSFNKNKNYFEKLHNAYELYYMALVFSLYSIANFFILPFIKLYTSGVNDINYLDDKLPLLFIATYLISCSRTSSSQVINFAGHFKETQSHAIIEAILNLTISLLGINFLGIYGVLLGTIVSLLYRANVMIIYSHINILKKSAWITYKRWIRNIIIFGIIVLINNYLKVDLTSYFKIICYCVPYTICTLFIYFGINSLFEKEIFKFVLSVFFKND